MTHRITLLLIGVEIVMLCDARQWLVLAFAVALAVWLVLDGEAFTRIHPDHGLDPDRPSR